MQRDHRESERFERETAVKTDRAALQAEARQLLAVIDDRTNTKAEKDAASARFQQIMARL